MALLAKAPPLDPAVAPLDKSGAPSPRRVLLLLRQQEDPADSSWMEGGGSMWCLCVHVSVHENAPNCGFRMKIKSDQHVGNR